MTLSASETDLSSSAINIRGVTLSTLMESAFETLDRDEELFERLVLP